MRIILGTPIHRLCEEDEFPDERTLYRWMLADPALCQKITQARAVARDKRMDEIDEIADDGRNDWMEQLDKEGGVAGWKLNGESVARSRLRVEARLKTAELCAPKKYRKGFDAEVASTITVKRVNYCEDVGGNPDSSH